MNNQLERITRKKQRLGAYQPIPPALVKNLDDWYRVELTYASNAIEGNTLTRQETALVVEKGITVAGKSLTENPEAANHAEAVDYVKTLVRTPRAQLIEDDLLQFHRLILQRIDDPTQVATATALRIAGSPVVLPNYVKVPGMMKEFIVWLPHDDIGLLPFTQAEPGLARRYDREQASARLHAILSLRARGLSLEEVKEQLEPKGHRPKRAA